MIEVQVTSDQAERVHLLLNDFRKNVPYRAIRSALDRGLSRARSLSLDEMVGKYEISKTKLRKNSRIVLHRPTNGSSYASISFAGTVIPLQQFKVSPSTPGQGTVTVSVLRSGGGELLQHAYVANLGRYGPGVFERMTSKRATSQQLYGPSAAHMMDRPAVQDSVASEAQKTVNERIEHEITRFLNGYGV